MAFGEKNQNNMMYLNIAGIPVKVAAMNEEIRKFFRPYSVNLCELGAGVLDNGIPDVYFSDNKIPDDRDLEIKAELNPIMITGHTSEELLRDLSNQMADRNVFLIHGSAISLDGQGYLFTAPSGTGKSTHSRLWKEIFGDRVVMINDDKPFLRVGMEMTECLEDSKTQIKEPGEPQLKLKQPGKLEKAYCKVYICGSPWNGKHRLGSNINAPLSGIAVLKQAKENRIECLSPQDAFRFLYTQIYLPKESERAQKVLDFMALLLVQVPVWMLYCRPDHDAVRVAAEAMCGKLG